MRLHTAESPNHIQLLEFSVGNMLQMHALGPNVGAVLRVLLQINRD